MISFNPSTPDIQRANAARQARTRKAETRPRTTTQIRISGGRARYEHGTDEEWSYAPAKLSPEQRATVVGSWEKVESGADYVVYRRPTPLVPAAKRDDND